MHRCRTAATCQDTLAFSPWFLLLLSTSAAASWRLTKAPGSPLHAHHLKQVLIFLGWCWWWVGDMVTAGMHAAKLLLMPLSQSSPSTCSPWLLLLLPTTTAASWWF
jgi:hypothetical protein